MKDQAENSIAVEVHDLTFSVGTAHHDGLIDVTRTSDGRNIDQFRAVPIPDTAADLLDAANDWVNRRIGAEPPPPTHCRACGTELHVAMNRDTDYQFDNALWVRFDGGYAMFIDPVEPDDLAAMNVVICHACAHKLCDAVPWIAELLNPERSHAHRADHHAELIAEGHRGWDLPH